MAEGKGKEMELRVLLLLSLVFVNSAGAFSSYDTQLFGSTGFVKALFVFGDSVLDAGTNSLFPSLLQANFKPYGAQFGKPTGRFTNGQTYADLFATRLGLPFVEPYLKRKGKWSIMQGVNYASAGSGLLRTSNAENHVIPFPDQILQFSQTRLQIEHTLKSAAGARELIASSWFLINIGGNDIVGYFFNPSIHEDEFLAKLMGILEDSIKVLYESGARKVVVLGTGPIGCVPGVLVISGVEDGHCIEPFNKVTKAYNAALAELLTKKLPKSMPDLKAVFANPYDVLLPLVTEKSNGFTAGVNACCGSGLYNAEAQCGRPANLITNPPTNLCNNVDEHVFWDYFHPTERVYSLVTEIFWNGSSNVLVPMTLEDLVNVQ